MPNRKGFWCLPLCCRTVSTSVEGSGTTTAAFFDLAKTMISKSSTLAFAPAFYRHGLITTIQACRGAVAQLAFRLAGASPGQMERIRDQVSALCSGRHAEQVTQIVTAGDVIATRLTVADGRYTGSVDFYASGQAKADHVRTLADRRGYRLADCFAYSDSVTDLPLLELVGHPHVVNPDRALRRVARERQWPELAFRQTGAAGMPAVTG